MRDDIEYQFVTKGNVIFIFKIFTTTLILLFLCYYRQCQCIVVVSVAAVVFVVVSVTVTNGVTCGIDKSHDGVVRTMTVWNNCFWGHRLVGVERRGSVCVCVWVMTSTQREAARELVVLCGHNASEPNATMRSFVSCEKN